MLGGSARVDRAGWKICLDFIVESFGKASWRLNRGKPRGETERSNAVDI